MHLQIVNNNDIHILFSLVIYNVRILLIILSNIKYGIFKKFCFKI